MVIAAAENNLFDHSFKSFYCIAVGIGVETACKVVVFNNDRLGCLKEAIGYFLIARLRKPGAAFFVIGNSRHNNIVVIA